MHTGIGRRLAFTAAATALLGRLVGCDSPTEVGISEVRITPDSADVVAGGETQLHAVILDGNGEEVTEATPEWSSADPTIATVDEQGMVVGQAPGTATIRAAIGGAAGSSKIQVLPRPSIIVTETDDGTEVSEAAGTDQVLVSLSAAPSTSVVLDASSDETVTAVSPERLTFTPENWDTPQAVTVTGLDDPAVEGPQVSTLTIAVDTLASDEAFFGAAIRTVSVTVTDDDVAGFALSPTGGSTRVGEGGSTDEVRVVLMAQPLTDVEVVAEVDDPSEVTIAPTRLTFTPANWSTSQLITVTGVDDAVADGPQESTLTVRVDASTSDDAFDGVQARTLSVTTDDDDAFGVSAATPTSHPDVPADQLVASYDLTTLTAEGRLRDFSGRDLHGTISGTTVIAAPRGGGRLFQEAPADRIELPPRSDFDLDGPLSIVARIRMDRQRRHQHVIACDDKFALTIREVDQVRLSNTRGDYAETLSPISAGVWHSVIAMFRGTVGDVLDDSNIEIWIDGVRMPITVRNATGTPPVVWRDGVLHPSDACYLGFESHQGEPGHQSLPFYGAIDEMVVFGRALTLDEIQLLAVSP